MNEITISIYDDEGLLIDEASFDLDRVTNAEIGAEIRRIVGESR